MQSIRAYKLGSHKLCTYCRETEMRVVPEVHIRHTDKRKISLANSPSFSKLRFRINKSIFLNQINVSIQG